MTNHSNDRFKMVDRSLISRGTYGGNVTIVKEVLAQLVKNPTKFIYVPLSEFATQNRGTIRSAFFRQRSDIQTFFEDDHIVVGLKEKK